MRREAIADLRAEAQRIAAAREVELDWDARGETAAVPTSPGPRPTGSRTRSRRDRATRPSACPAAPATTAWRWPRSPEIAMLFVRCERGISHNPAEAVAEADVAVALDVLERFVGDLA